MKLKYKKVKQRHTLICSDLKKEGINRKELDILYEPPEGLIRVIDFNEIKRTITYDVGCCIPIESYYKQKCFTENEVLQIVRQFLTVLENMEKYHLTKQKLILEFKYVFFNITQAMPEFVFCPVQNNYSPLESEQIFNFLKELVTSAIIIRDRTFSDNDKIQSFLLFLKKQQQFSTEEILVFFEEDYVAQSLITELAVAVPRPSVSYSTASQRSTISANQGQYMPGFTSNSPESINRKNSEDASQSSSTISRPASVLHTGYNQLKPSATFSSALVAMSPIIQASDTIDDDIDSSIIQPSDTITFNETAYLKNEVTGIEYELPFGDCIIGRAGVDQNGKPVVPDLVVTDNMRVRKFHAKITYDGSDYYIIDLATKNKTKINGEVIESGIDPISGSFNGKKTKIENDTKIQLASELYTFLIKES